MVHTAFEHLLELNRNVDAAIATLQKLAEYPELKNEDFTVRQIYLREHLAVANIHILDALKESELKTNGLAFKERSLYEKKTRDPDDCYLEVSHVNFATTITERDRPDDDSVGKALAKIGEPAIEPLRNILENYNNNQSLRMRSVLVLYNMNLSPADQVLARQLQSETDPRVKSVIESRVRARKEMNNTK